MRTATSAGRLRWVPSDRLLPIVVAAALVLGGCGIGSPGVAAPTDAPASLAPLSTTVELTRGTLERALKAAGIGLIRPTVPFRPPEEARLIDASRTVFQAVLPADPTGGYLVVYEQPDAGTAYATALAQATWLESGPGAVQFPPGTRHVIRVVGPTIVTFSLKPESPDPETASRLIAALETVGRGVPVIAP